MEHVALDPAAGDFAGHLAWKPPAVVRDASLRQQNLEDVHKDQLRQVEELERQLEDWIADGRSTRNQVWRRVAGKKAPASIIEQLTTRIEALERDCEEEANGLKRMREAFRRDQQKVARRSKTASAAIKQIDDRIVAAHERVLHERLELALFLRACRAELDPDTSGETFEDPADLERNLRALLWS